MAKTLILILLSCYCFLYPTSTQAEKIKSHFNRLPLMKEKASVDGNRRAIENIDQISKTPNGEYFEVDNKNPPIESLIYKIDKTRQWKPLRETKDENLIIYYFHKVDAFANNYYKIVDSIITAKVEPAKATSRLEKLDATYPNFGATYTALVATTLASHHTDKATFWAEKAVSLNRNNPKALLMLSIGEYARGKKRDSLRYLSDAKKIDPNVTDNYWEIQYVKDKTPETFSDWFKKTD